MTERLSDAELGMLVRARNELHQAVKNDAFWGTRSYIQDVVALGQRAITELQERRAADAQVAQGAEADWKALRLSDFADPIVLITEGVIDALRIAHRHGYHARDAELQAVEGTGLWHVTYDHSREPRPLDGITDICLEDGRSIIREVFPATATVLVMQHNELVRLRAVVEAARDLLDTDGTDDPKEWHMAQQALTAALKGVEA